MAGVAGRQFGEQRLGIGPFIEVNRDRLGRQRFGGGKQQRLDNPQIAVRDLELLRAPIAFTCRIVHHVRPPVLLPSVRRRRISSGPKARVCWSSTCP